MEGTRGVSEESCSNGLATEVKSALAEITSLLTNVVQRVENVEAELQKQRSTASPSSSESSAKEQVHVSRIVRLNRSSVKLCCFEVTLLLRVCSYACNWMSPRDTCSLMTVCFAYTKTCLCPSSVCG